MPLKTNDKTRTTVMDQSTTAGNASDRAKDYVIRLLQTFYSKTNGFGVNVGSRMEITDISVVQKVEESQVDEGCVICEITVDEGI